MADDPHGEAGFLHAIIGESLSAVTFVMDYIQLHFNGSGLTALTLPSIRISGRLWTASDEGWRDRLCERIGIVVRRAYIQEEELAIDFEDGARIAVSLRPSDYRGPEAINFSSPGQPLVVL